MSENFNYSHLTMPGRGRPGYIGHPYPETLRLLEAQLPRLRERGIDLVPVSSLIDRRILERTPLPRRISMRGSYHQH